MAGSNLRHPIEPKRVTTVTIRVYMPICSSVYSLEVKGDEPTTISCAIREPEKRVVTDLTDLYFKRAFIFSFNLRPPDIRDTTLKYISYEKNGQGQGLSPALLLKKGLILSGFEGGTACALLGTALTVYLHRIGGAEHVLIINTFSGLAFDLCLGPCITGGCGISHGRALGRKRAAACLSRCAGRTAVYLHSVQRAEMAADIAAGRYRTF